jgi:hypothetical protein
MKPNKQSHAAAQLVAIIDQMRNDALVAQEMNQVYKNFILAQSTEMEIIKTNLKIKELENQSLTRQLKQRRK